MDTMTVGHRRRRKGLVWHPRRRRCLCYPQLVCAQNARSCMGHSNPPEQHENKRRSAPPPPPLPRPGLLVCHFDGLCPPLRPRGIRDQPQGPAPRESPGGALGQGGGGHGTAAEGLAAPQEGPRVPHLPMCVWGGVDKGPQAQSPSPPQTPFFRGRGNSQGT